MMLDTNALSAWANADPAMLRALPKDRLWHLPVVVLGEFIFGLRRSRDRDSLERWLEEVKTACTVVTIDADTAEHYATLRENDIWIAALCLQHRLPLASRDHHFDKVRGLTRMAW